MSVTLDQLRVLDAIDRLGSFAAAAREMARATSAMSYQIKSLEDALGFRVFDRSGHRAKLTSNGHRILGEARRVLRQVQRLEEIGREIDAGYEPLLQIVVDGILPLPPIMEALRTLSDEGLPTRVRLMVEYLGGVRERFEGKGADLMLVLDHEADDSLEAVALAPVETYLVAHREHPVVGAGRPIDRAELREHVELVVADSARASDGAPHRLFLGAPQVFELSDFHSKTEALLGGVGYGWLPHHLAEPHLSSGDLAEVPFAEGARYTFHPQLVHRAGATIGPACRMLMALFERAMPASSRAASQKG
jgi:DNA-binding transcriptional LysR family regulator